MAPEAPKKVSAMGGGVNVSVRCSGLGNPKFRDVGCTSTCSFGCRGHVGIIFIFTCIGNTLFIIYFNIMC